MAYTPLTWKDHVLSNENFIIKNNSDGTASITPAGKTVSQGTLMSADNFNHMEEGIFQASEDVEILKSGKANKSDVYAKDGINSMYAGISTTLGTQCKNMFNPNAVDWYKASDISISSNGTITSNVTSDNRDINNYSTAEYKINLLPGTYKIIYNVTSYTSGTARICVFVNGVYKTELGITSTGNRTATITLE